MPHPLQALPPSTLDVLNLNEAFTEFPKAGISNSSFQYFKHSLGLSRVLAPCTLGDFRLRAVCWYRAVADACSSYCCKAYC